MMFCRYCGKKIPDDSVFCASCGNQVGEPDKSDVSIKSAGVEAPAPVVVPETVITPEPMLVSEPVAVPEPVAMPDPVIAPEPVIVPHFTPEFTPAPQEETEPVVTPTKKRGKALWIIGAIALFVALAVAAFFILKPFLFTTKSPEHSHSYSKYVCSECGAIDKTHAYEYLIEWVKQNGKVDGTRIHWDEYSEGFLSQMSYDTKEESFYIDWALNSDGRFAFVLFDFKDRCYLSSVEFEDGYVLELFGPLSPETFTKSSSLPYENYSGSTEAKSEFLDYSQWMVCSLLDWFEDVLEGENIGITLADLGFTAYKS